MSVTSYLYIVNRQSKTQIEGNPEEGPNSKTATQDGKKTNNMMQIISSNLSIRNNWDSRSGQHADSPETNEVSLTIKWDNSMTVLFDSLMYGDDLDCKLYFFGKGIEKEGVDSKPHNWFTIELIDSRLAMTDLFKPQTADSRMDEEVISINISFKAIRITDHDMKNATASYDWGDKTGEGDFPIGLA